MGIGQGVETWGVHSGITCVLQAQFSGFFLFLFFFFFFFFLCFIAMHTRMGILQSFLVRYQMYRVSLQYGLEFHLYFLTQNCLGKISQLLSQLITLQNLSVTVAKLLPFVLEQQ